MQGCHKLLCQISSSVFPRAAPFKRYLHPHAGWRSGENATETATHSACTYKRGGREFFGDGTERWSVYEDWSGISIQ